MRVGDPVRVLLSGKFVSGTVVKVNARSFWVDIRGLRVKRKPRHLR